MQKAISVEKLLDKLGHEERQLKNLGAFANAAGVRTAIVAILRLADEEPTQPSLEEPDGS